MIRSNNFKSQIKPKLFREERKTRELMNLLITEHLLMQLRTQYTVLEKKNTKSKGTSKKMKEDDTLNDERIMKVENIKTRTHKPYALKGRSV